MKNKKNKIKLSKIRYFFSGLILGIFIFTAGVSASGGTLGELFKFTSNWQNSGAGGVYVLDGKNIEDGTITKFELADNSVGSGEIIENSIGNSELKNTETFNIAKLGIGVLNPLADLHIKGDGLIKLEGGGMGNTGHDYWSLNAYDNGTDFSISRSDAGVSNFIFRQGGNLEISGYLKTTCIGNCP